MLKISEIFFSGDGTTGETSSDEYSAFVWGDPVADSADDVATVVIFALNHFALLSEMGNVFNDFDRKRIGPGRWQFTAKYKSIQASRQTNDASFSFQIGGGTKHINSSLETTIVNVNDPLAVPPPNHHGAINVGTDGSIGGVDIEAPNYSFKTTYYVDPDNMTSDYLSALKYAIANPVNSDVVTVDVDGLLQEFQPGELRLRGADGSKRVGFGDWELSLSWGAAMNQTNLNIGDDGDGNPTLTIPTLNGWDMLEVTFNDTGGSNWLEKLPTGAYVHRIYERSALSGILPVTDFGQNNTQPWLSPTLYGGAGSLGSP